MLKYFDDENKAKQKASADAANRGKQQDLISGLFNKLQSNVTDLLFREGELKRKREQLMKEAAAANIVIDLPEEKTLEAKAIKEEIDRALAAFPSEMQTLATERIMTEAEEARAHNKAEEINKQIRPRVEALFTLIEGTILKASESGLIQLKRTDALPTLPERIVYTQHELNTLGISREQTQLKQTFEFEQGGYWHLFPSFGVVRSPESLAAWAEKADHWHPMLRIHRANNEPLASIAFDPTSGDLIFAYNGNDRSRLESVFSAIRQEKSGEVMVVTCLVELLKQERLRSGVR